MEIIRIFLKRKPNEPLEQITDSPTDVVLLVSPSSMVSGNLALMIVLYEGHLRDIVAGIHKTHPEILREILCEECPEHLGTVK